MAHDDNKEYAGKGVAGSALGLGIAGTALALLNNNGGLGNLLGVNNGNCYGGPTTRFGGYGCPGPIAAPMATGFEVGYVIDNERRIGRLEAKTEGIEVAVIKDKEIADLKTQLVQANLVRYVDDKTCGVIKGQPYLSPSQMADPYMGNRMVISTHHPVIDVEPHRRGFFDNGCWY